MIDRTHIDYEISKLNKEIFSEQDRIRSLQKKIWEAEEVYENIVRFHSRYEKSVNDFYEKVNQRLGEMDAESDFPAYLNEKIKNYIFGENETKIKEDILIAKRKEKDLIEKYQDEIYCIKNSIMYKEKRIIELREVLRETLRNE